MNRRTYRPNEFKDGVTITPSKELGAYVFEKLVVGDFVAALTLHTSGAIRGELVTVGGGYPGEILVFNESGEILTKSGISVGSYSDEPIGIAVAFFVETKSFDVYLNGELKLKDYKPPRRVTSDKCVAIELRLASGSLDIAPEMEPRRSVAAVLELDVEHEARREILARNLEPGAEHVAAHDRFRQAADFDSLDLLGQGCERGGFVGRHLHGRAVGMPQEFPPADVVEISFASEP